MKRGLLIISGGVADQGNVLAEELKEQHVLEIYTHIAVAAKSDLNALEILKALRKKKVVGMSPAFESNLAVPGFSLKSHQVERLRSFGVNNWDICGYFLESSVLACSFNLFDSGLNPRILARFVSTEMNDVHRSSMLDNYRKLFGAHSVLVGPYEGEIT